MRHDAATTLAARRLRKWAQPDPTDATILRAGAKLRKIRGPFRDQYSTEEVELMARARRVSFEIGQLKLARFLTLRRRKNQRRSLHHGGTAHNCPKCGHWHHEPRYHATRAALRDERRRIREAVEKAKR